MPTPPVSGKAKQNGADAGHDRSEPPLKRVRSDSNPEGSSSTNGTDEKTDVEEEKREAKDVEEPSLEAGSEPRTAEPPMRRVRSVSIAEPPSHSGAEQGNDDEEEEQEEAEDVEEPPLEAGSEAPSSVYSGTPSAKRKKRRHRHRHEALLDASAISALVFATLWGVLARLGLNWIGGFAVRVVDKTVWAQIVGCLIMGCVVERKKGLEKFYPPLFVALGTGFCGSLTTFSSWMVDVFTNFAALDVPSSGRFSNFLSGVATTFVTLGLSTASLRLGVHLSSALPHRPPSDSTSSHPKRSPFPPLSYHFVTLLLGPLFYLGALLLLILGPARFRSRATFALVLGPPGTLLRYYFSKKLNPLKPSLPLGTLSANTLAVTLFAVTALLQRRPGTGGLGCAALQGVQDGFCGSLSTVSTFVVELRSLRRRESWTYAAVSWGLAQGVLVIVLGGWIWSTGDRVKCAF